MNPRTRLKLDLPKESEQTIHAQSLTEQMLLGTHGAFDMWIALFNMTNAVHPLLDTAATAAVVMHDS